MVRQNDIKGLHIIRACDIMHLYWIFYILPSTTTLIGIAEHQRDSVSKSERNSTQIQNQLFVLKKYQNSKIYQKTFPSFFCKILNLGGYQKVLPYFQDLLYPTNLACACCTVSLLIAA